MDGDTLHREHNDGSRVTAIMCRYRARDVRGSDLRLGVRPADEGRSDGHVVANLRRYLRGVDPPARAFT